MAHPSCHLRALKTTERYQQLVKKLLSTPVSRPEEEREDNAATSRFYFKKRRQNSGFEASLGYTVSSEQPGLLPRQTLTQKTSKQKCGANEYPNSRNMKEDEELENCSVVNTMQFLQGPDFSSQHPIKVVAAIYNSNSRGFNTLSWPAGTLIMTTDAHKYRHIIKITNFFKKSFFKNEKQDIFSYATSF